MKDKIIKLLTTDTSASGIDKVINLLPNNSPHNKGLVEAKRTSKKWGKHFSLYKGTVQPNNAPNVRRRRKKDKEPSVMWRLLVDLKT